MSYSETITLTHPDTDEELELTVEFDYSPAERQTLDCPGCPAEVVIESIEDSKGTLYEADTLWTDDEIIEALHDQADNGEQ